MVAKAVHQDQRESNAATAAFGLSETACMEVIKMKVTY